MELALIDAGKSTSLPICCEAFSSEKVLHCIFRVSFFFSWRYPCLEAGSSCLLANDCSSVMFPFSLYAPLL
jgi:hypothetical protein